MMSPFLPACSHLLPFTPDREDADWPKSGFLCKVSLVNERSFSEAWASPCKAALLQRPTPHPPPLPPPTPSAHGQVHCWSPLTKDKPEGCTLTVLRGCLVCLHFSGDLYHSRFTSSMTRGRMSPTGLLSLLPHHEGKI